MKAHVHPSRKPVPPNYWSNIANQRKFMEDISKELGITKMDDWYKVTTKMVIDKGGIGLLNTHYDSSVINALKIIYPEHPWKPWLFFSVPNGYWNDRSNIIECISWLEHKLGIQQPSDWYKFTVKQIKDAGGRGILARFHDSMFNMLSYVYPEHNWHPWLLQNVPRGYWDNFSHVIKFIHWCKDQLSIQNFEDWYDVSVKTFKQLGGSGILLKYGPDIATVLAKVYPEYKWKPWLFDGHLSPGHWKIVQNQRDYLEWLADQLNIKSPQDWRRVTWQDFTSRRGIYLLHIHGNSFLKLFSSVYPDEDWTSIFGSNTMLSKTKSQQYLLRTLRLLFPNDAIKKNFRHPELTFASSGRKMELDAFIEAKQLAFEYQGQQHYKHTGLSELSTQVFQERDMEKKNRAKEKGITLIEVPFWWDKTTNSLIASIIKERPDLISTLPSIDPNTAPINLTPQIPEGSIQLLLAQTYQSNMDPTGWWISEKYDGIRAYWDGKQFKSRNFLPLQVQESITKQMPPDTLDGEIWFGYNTGRESMQVVHKAKKIQWDRMQYLVFDAPHHGGPFEQRMEYLHKLIPSDHPFIKVVPMTQCLGRDHMEQQYNEILRQGGEGIMLRKPQSPYSSGRSPNLLKLKPYRDGEALVVTASENLDHFEFKLPSGVVFSTYVSSSLRPALKVGSLVTFQCSGYFINGRPRKPWIKSLREDMTLDDLLLDRYHYWVEKNSMRGNCAACNKGLPSHSLRACTKGLQGTTPGSASKALKVQFCLQYECLISGRSKLAQDENPIVVEPFRDTLVIPSRNSTYETPFGQTINIREELRLYVSARKVRVVSADSFANT